jgi:hypothetical protein
VRRRERVNVDENRKFSSVSSQKKNYMSVIIFKLISINKKISVRNQRIIQTCRESIEADDGIAVQPRRFKVLRDGISAIKFRTPLIVM